MKSLMHAFTTTLVIILVAIFTGPIAHAAIEGGDAAKGKALARTKCRPCHVAGASGGTVTPLSKTQRQWDRFYKKDRHNKKAPGTWDKITQNELTDIMQYMHDHAADSPQPETCGQ